MRQHVKRPGLCYDAEVVASFETAEAFVKVKSAEVNWINVDEKAKFLTSIYNEAKAMTKKPEKKPDVPPGQSAGTQAKTEKPKSDADLG